MSVPNPMTREELLELSALDALGLLEEYEAALFTRSFHHAPAAVQDEILNLQAEIVSDAALLPKEEPEPALRQRVLAAVARSIDHEARELAPIATIGRVRSESEVGGAVLRMIPSVQFWRAAAFAMAAGALICLFFLAQTTQKSHEIMLSALSVQTDHRLEELIGPGFKTFVNNSKCVNRGLRAPDGQGAGSATVYIDSEGDRLFMLAFALSEPNEPFTLRHRAEDGTTTVLAQFIPGANGITPVEVTGFPSGQFTRGVLEVVSAAGAVILTTA